MNAIEKLEVIIKSNAVSPETRLKARTTLSALRMEVLVAEQREYRELARKYSRVSSDSMVEDEWK